ncbi:hypothetical protein HYH02_008348 [Chlamydomonas schloesseri]|uniref:tRNA/rRNA methyltransferase SpoU type domain-containing protein n=1 Tax=Chlamydomonas schloesseri TaxID=2026947 RepID=A0A835WG06_9CHLO|nr:hypothetical protein HYH02_008348 [Chlamydomonas schloesseri]|eukprot:KAG2446788.1 hypothetical protein HYH02_008348 [Chlamydomonas schloesseri]
MRAHTCGRLEGAHADRKPNLVSFAPSRCPRVSQVSRSSLVCNSDPRARTKWYGVYTEEQYNAQRQSEERAKWAAGVRSITGNRDHTAWDGSQLDPPALLSGVTVVIISPRKPVTVGTVARALGSFECEDLRIVMPRQESYITRRHAKSASKGAQYILYRAGHYDSIAEATSDCDVRVAFTRWAQSSSPHVYKVDINGLVSHPAVANVINQPLLRSPPPPPPPSSPWTAAAAAAAEAAEARLGGASPASASSAPASGDEEEEDAVAAAESRRASSASASSVGEHASTSSSSSSISNGSSSNGSTPRMPKIALVFGREELGMSDEEVDGCEVCCSVPIGRLQESLSLSHAVSIALCNLYQARLQHLTSSAGAADEGGEGAAAGGGDGFNGSYLIDPSTGALRVAPST